MHPIIRKLRRELGIAKLEREAPFVLHEGRMRKAWRVPGTSHFIWYCALVGLLDIRFKEAKKQGLA